MSLPAYVVFDVESFGLDPRRPDFKLLMVGMYDGADSVQIFPADRCRVAASILQEYERKGVKLVAWNAAFDARVLHQVCGVDLHPHDPMLMAYLLREDVRHDLKSTAVTRLGVEPWEHGIRERIAKGDIPEAQELGAYCARDCLYTEKLYTLLRSELVRDDALARVYARLLRPASGLFRTLEQRGIYISASNLERAKDTAADSARSERDRIGRLALDNGCSDFNPNAPHQVADLLFSRLGLPPLEHTEKGQPSTKAVVLKRLRGRHPIVDSLLAYRRWTKLEQFATAYADLREQSPEGRVYPHYHLLTVTGRTGASEPNIQQIPRDPLVRSIIAAPPGKVLVSADGSQMELRVAAFISREPAMLRAFREGRDLHFEMAMRVNPDATIHDATMLLMRAGLPTNRAGAQVLSNLFHADREGKAAEIVCSLDDPSREESWYRIRLSSLPTNGRQEPILEKGINTLAASVSEDLLRAVREYEALMSAPQESGSDRLGALQFGDAVQVLSSARAQVLAKLSGWKERRSRSKPIGFGFIYGAEEETYIDQALKDFDLVVTMDEAVRDRAAFFALWPGLGPWYAKVWEEVSKEGIMRSPLGRIRHLGDIQSSTPSIRQEALRQAINFPVQSMASDLALMAAMILEEVGWPVVAFIHDSVLLEVPVELGAKAAAGAKAAMEVEVPRRLSEDFGINLDVPLQSDVIIGSQWE